MFDDSQELGDPVTCDRGRIGAAVSDFGPPPLKRAPKPYAPDHPQAEVLTRKNLVISAPFPGDWRDKGLIRSALDLSRAMLPAWNWMDSSQ